MFRHILIVVDSRPVSRAAVQEGVGLARVHGAQVTFFHALPRFPAPLMDAPMLTSLSEPEFDEAAMDVAHGVIAAAARVAEKSGVRHRSVVEHADDEAHHIVEVAQRRRCDLIVVASEGRNALLRLVMGSVIPGLITAAPMPVMVCKGAEKVPVARKAAVVPLRKARASRPRSAVAG